MHRTQVRRWDADGDLEMTRRLSARFRTRVVARLRDEEDGSLLVEVMITAALLVMVSLGVLVSFDAASAQSGEQKVQAVAVDVAQTEMDELRGASFDTLRGLNGTPVQRQSGGIDFTIVSRAEQVVDANGPVGCATPRNRDLLRVTTTVSWTPMGTRRPVTVESLVAAPVGASGALIVQVLNRNATGVPGIVVNLSGPSTASATTDANGCARWDTLPAGRNYALGFSSAGYVDPEGVNAVTKTFDVPAEQTKVLTFEYDRAGTVPLRFYSELDEDDIPDIDEDEVEWYEDFGRIYTDPERVSFEHSRLPLPRAFDLNVGPPSPRPSPWDAPAAGSVGGLFPFTSPYAVYADGCAAAKPASPPAVSLPSDAIGAATVAPGATSATQRIRLPPLIVRVRNSAGSVPASYRVRVTTACGTVLPDRELNQDRNIADPGLPFGLGLSVCAFKPPGSNYVVRQVDNVRYDGSVVTLDLGDPLQQRTTGAAGVCA